MNYEIQFAKVTNSGKLQDRFLSCQHSKSKDLTKSPMGEIFSLVEILSPWFNSAQIGQMIINDFSESYFGGGSTSDLQNFENGLKKINENLAQITQNGETEWIGNLNGILMAIVDDNLILSPSGRAEACLFRDGKINHLTYGLTNQAEVHPLKTFSNVISGQLKTHDKILVANKNLFSHISLESLRQIITLNNPANASGQITKLLRKMKVKNVNLIIMNLIDKNEVANQSLENLENVFYLDKSAESFIGRLRSLGEFLSGVGKIFGSLFKTLGRFLAKIFGKKGKKSSDHALKITSDKMPKAADKFQQEFMTKDSRDDELLKDEEIKYSPELYVHYYKERKARKENKLAQILGILLNKIHNFGSWLLVLYRNPRKRKFLYIVAAIILILVIGLVVATKSKKGNVGSLKAQKILDEAILLQKEAKGLLAGGNPEKAKEKYTLSIEKAQSIREQPLVAKDAEAVIVTNLQELDKLTSTTRFSRLEPIVTIPETAKGIFFAQGQAIIITENDIYKTSILGGKPEKVSTFPKNKGSFISGAALGNLLYFYTNSQNLFEFDPSSDKLETVKIAAEGRWETANALAGYVGTLYLLDGVRGQIYKHSSDGDVFRSGEEYSSNAAKLKESVSLAIDGTVYVLKNSGEVLKFQRSKLQDFILKNIPTPQNKITSPRKIYTDADTPSLYILDSLSTSPESNPRILEFDKEGVFIRQYALPESFQKISDFIVLAKSKKIWILNDNSLYEIAI